MRVARRKQEFLRQLGGVLLGVTFILGKTGAQVNTEASQSTSQGASPWDGRDNPDAKQADAWYDNYKFRDGETIDRLRIHYATLGEPHRNLGGIIDNAALVLHWTGAHGRALLSPTYMKALFDPGRPLDAR